MINILYVDDNPHDRDLVIDTLEKEHSGFHVQLAGSRSEFEAALANSEFQLVLSDFNILGYEGLDVLAAVRARNPSLPVIIITGTGSEEVAVEAMRLGATDYIIKSPSHIRRLPATIYAALEKMAIRLALQETEARYRSLVEAAPAMIVLVRNRRIAYINPAGTRLFGAQQPQDLLGQPFFTVIHPDSRQSILNYASQLAPGEAGPVIINRGVRLDGEALFMEGSTTCQEQDGQKVYQIIAYDVTQRAQAEERLRFQAVQLENVNDAIIGSDAQFRLTGWNAVAEKVYGWKAEEVLGRNGLDILQTQWPEAEAEAMRQVIAETGQWRGEATQARKDGSRFPVEVSSVVLRDGRGEISGYVSVNRDISERKGAEEALRQAEENYRQIFENAEEGIHQTSPEGRYLTANPATARMLGYDSLEDFLADPPELNRQFYVQPGRRAEFQKEIEEHGRVSNFESEAYRKDGSRFWISLNARAVRDPQGNLRYYEGTSTDITQRKQDEERILREVQRLNALHEIDIAIRGTPELRQRLDVLVQEAAAALRADAVSVLLLDEPSATLHFAAGIGFHTPAVTNTHLQVGEGYAGRAVLENRLVEIQNLAVEPEGLLRNELRGEGFVMHHAAPLVTQGEFIGVLEVFQRASMERDEGWHDFLITLAGLAAIAIESARLYETALHSRDQLLLAYDATIEGWSRALDLRDKETEYHTRRVTEMTVALARQMGVNEDELRHVRRGALLHDIGKLGIPDEILHKPGPLTDAEWVIMHRHPTHAYEMLSPIPYLELALDIPYCHHEKWDGSGYPRGLKGTDIPRTARIFAVVDVWDALTSDRPYRSAWTPEQARQHIREQSGTHFDPEVVNAFLDMQGG